ncbi:MAG: hypothetical protein RL199_1199 [Pseudomonadota bacterium]|jgi:O-succinylbenzoate synthase
MTLRLRVARWSRPMRGAPAIGAGAPLRQRQGLLVALGQDERWGLGDASPLPGLSRESLEEVDGALERGRDFLVAHPRAADDLPPSLAMALEAARFDLADEAHAPPPSLRTSHLAGDDEPPGASGPARTIKLKVGRRPLAEECGRVAAFAAAGRRVRLDGNRRLDRDAARALVAAAGGALDFIEEPGPGISAQDLGAPVALDESLDDALARLEPEEGDDALEQALRPLGHAAVWVVKPTVLGPRRTRQLARLAQRLGIRVVLSSAYDSSVGRRGLVRLGASLGLDAEVHGLGTGDLLTPDIEAGPGPVLVENDGLVRVGAPLTPAAFPGLTWREVSP